MGMPDKSALQQKLQELEQIRAKTIEQIPLSHGNLRDELQHMLEGLDAEIAVLHSEIEKRQNGG
jgi:hypothetical protein